MSLHLLGIPDLPLRAFSHEGRGRLSRLFYGEGQGRGGETDGGGDDGNADSAGSGNVGANNSAETETSNLGGYPSDDADMDTPAAAISDMEGLGGWVDADVGWGVPNVATVNPMSDQALANYSSRKQAEDAAVRASADKAETKDNWTMVLTAIAAITGIPLAAVIAQLAPSLIVGDELSAKEMAGGLATAFGLSPLATQATRMAVGLAVDDQMPSWADWGGLATTALGVGGFPGRAIGGYAQTGVAPSLASFMGYTASRLGPELGINPQLASFAASRLGASIEGSLAAGRAGTSPADFSGQDIYGGLESGGRGWSASDLFSGGPSGISGGGYIFGGLSLDDGGSGIGSFIPESGRGGPVGGRPSSQTRNLSASGGSDGMTGDAPMEVILARTIGGRRPGF